MNLQNAWITMLDAARERKAARESARELRRDLSVFTTPSEIDDLLVALDRAEGPEVATMRGILQDNLRQFYRQAS